MSEGFESNDCAEILGMVPRGLVGRAGIGLSCFGSRLSSIRPPPDLRREAEAAMAAALDDPSPQVRRALAEVLAGEARTPRHVVIALAHDQPDIAALVLAQSPLLGDGDLVDCASMGDRLAQSAIASRPHLSAAVAAVLAEKGHPDSLVVLARNAQADIPDASLLRMVERCGEDGALREAILQREDLPPAVRTDLLRATALVLADFVTECGWLTRDRADHVTRESCDRATALLAYDAYRDEDEDGAIAMASHLRLRGRLTPAFLLRMLLTGDRSLFTAALADLSGLPLPRVAGFVRLHASGGFAAVYARARMPADMLGVFRAALAAQDQCNATATTGQGCLLRPLVSFVLRDCAQTEMRPPPQLQALLRRFEAEAARTEARLLTSRLIRVDGQELATEAAENGLEGPKEDALEPG